MGTTRLSGENVKALKGTADIHTKHTGDNPIHFIFYNTFVLTSDAPSLKNEFNKIFNTDDLIALVVSEFNEKNICEAFKNHFNNRNENQSNKTTKVDNLKYEVAGAQP